MENGVAASAEAPYRSGRRLGSMRTPISGCEIRCQESRGHSYLLVNGSQRGGQAKQASERKGWCAMNDVYHLIEELVIVGVRVINGIWVYLT